MRLRPVLAAACAAVALGALPAAAAAPSCAGLPKHSKIPVVDAANVVPPEAEAYLAADLMRYQVAEKTAIVAATVPNLGGDDVSAYARRLFDCWGVGDAARDDGVLILVAMREQRVRIEAGAGLEDRLSEQDLETAIDEMVAPLKRGDVAGGMRAAAVSVAGTLGGVFPDTKRDPTRGIPGAPRVPVTPTAPGEVVDVVDDPGTSEDFAYPGGYRPPSGVSPYRVDDGGGPGFGGLGIVFVIIAFIAIGSFVRRLVGGVGSAFGGPTSSWSGGYGGHGGWGAASMLRGGSWHSDSDSDSGSGWSSGSSSGSSSSFGSSGSFGGGSSGSSGSSGGGSFGGGSSGGGGASGSW